MYCDIFLFLFLFLGNVTLLESQSSYAHLTIWRKVRFNKGGRFITEAALANPGTEQEGATLGSRMASATSRSKANFLRPLKLYLCQAAIYLLLENKNHSQPVNQCQSVYQLATIPAYSPAYLPTYLGKYLPHQQLVHFLLASRRVTLSQPPRGTIACRTLSFGILLWYSLLWDSLLWDNCVWDTLPLGTLHSVLTTSILITNVG